MQKKFSSTGVCRKMVACQGGNSSGEESKVALWVKAFAAKTHYLS